MKQPRNEACACGSGLKHKKCCGDEATKNAQWHQAREAMMVRIRQKAADRMQEESEGKKTPRWTPLLLTAALASAAYYPNTNQR